MHKAEALTFKPFFFVFLRDYANANTKRGAVVLTQTHLATAGTLTAREAGLPLQVPLTAIEAAARAQRPPISYPQLFMT